MLEKRINFYQFGVFDWNSPGSHFFSNFNESI
jgi:hypothetical protein